MELSKRHVTPASAVVEEGAGGDGAVGPKLVLFSEAAACDEDANNPSSSTHVRIRSSPRASCAAAAAGDEVNSSGASSRTTDASSSPVLCSVGEALDAMCRHWEETVGGCHLSEEDKEVIRVVFADHLIKCRTDQRRAKLTGSDLNLQLEKDLAEALRKRGVHAEAGDGAPANRRRLAEARAAVFQYILFTVGLAAFLLVVCAVVYYAETFSTIE